MSDEIVTLIGGPCDGEQMTVSGAPVAIWVPLNSDGEHARIGDDPAGSPPSSMSRTSGAITSGARD